jgi:F0F1-type ATP synthase membrane subunit b/b'
MTIEWLRDLVIIITDLVVLGAAIFLAILAYLIYRRLKPILNSLSSTTANIENTIKQFNELANPIIKLAAIIVGIFKGMKSARRKSNKKGRQENER